MFDEDERFVTSDFISEDAEIEYGLRPRSLSEYIGQEKIKDNLSKRTIKNDSCVYEWNPADIIPLKTFLRNKDINVDFYYITKNNIYKIIKSNRVNNRKPHTVINNGTKTQLYRKLEPFNGIYMLLRSVDKDNKSKKRVMVEHDDIEKIYNINRNGNDGIKKTEIEDNEELNKMEEDYLEETAE